MTPDRATTPVWLQRRTGSTSRKNVSSARVLTISAAGNPYAGGTIASLQPPAVTRSQ